MLIGIDTSRTAESKTGLGSSASSLLAAMARIDKANDYLLYPFVWDCFPPNYEEAFCPDQENFRVARKHVPKWLIRRLWATGAVNKGRLLGGDPDVFFSPFHSVPQRHYRRLVCTFHDVSFRLHPEFSTQANIDHCEASFARALTLADHLVTSSHHSKRDMVEVMGVPEEFVSVTHLAADPKFRRIEGTVLPQRVREAFDEHDRTILYVGSVEPRKNIATLIKAYDALIQRGRIRPKLIIAGGSGWKNSDVYGEIDRRGLKDQVLFTGFVTDEELIQLYNAADVFAFPTIYEGFGLPVIEAMSCGTPVITTRVASIPEIGGDAVVYMDDPLDGDNLSRLLEEILLDRELHADLRARGFAQAATFSWERTAQETLAILTTVHENPRYLRRHVTFGADERGLGRGWHATESDDERTFRWAEREATVRLAPVGRSCELVVDVAGNIPGEEQILSVRVNGIMVGSVPLGTWRVSRFRIPDFVPRDRECEVSLRVNFELTPAMKGADPRSLGFLATRIAFEPVQPSVTAGAPRS